MVPAHRFTERDVIRPTVGLNRYRAAQLTAIRSLTGTADATCHAGGSLHRGTTVLRR
jgi:hypothetical protein